MFGGLRRCRRSDGCLPGPLSQAQDRNVLLGFLCTRTIQSPRLLAAAALGPHGTVLRFLVRPSWRRISLGARRGLRLRNGWCPLSFSLMLRTQRSLTHPQKRTLLT